MQLKSPIKYSLFALFYIIGISLNAQKLKVDFQLRVLPDNFWHLELYNNNTYKYTYFNGWAGETILDSGSYTKTRHTITLTSYLKDSTDQFPYPRTLYLTKIKIKKHEIIAHQWTEELFSILGRKHIVLSEEPFCDCWIQDKREPIPHWQ